MPSSRSASENSEQVGGCKAARSSGSISIGSWSTGWTASWKGLSLPAVGVLGSCAVAALLPALNMSHLYLSPMHPPPATDAVLLPSPQDEEEEEEEEMEEETEETSQHNNHGDELQGS